jgi:hypothetical protein
MSVAIFHRKTLAENIAKRTLSPKGVSGVFISAPRRTGKSTLINEDIVPYLRDAGAEVIYVDLWSDRSRDPGDLISEAIREHLLQREGAILKWARKGGLDKVKLAGIEMDIGKVGIGSEKTIAKALAELSDATEHMIVLVIDEAQHAITTGAGADTLFALKAARDQLNGSAHFGFRLIATGSNRDKLSLLVQGKDQAFLSAVLMDLEPLGDDYLAWELDQYDEVVKPSVDVVKRAFVAAGHKPETLRKALDDLACRFYVTAENVDAVFQDVVDKIMAEAKQGFMRQINSLPPLQAAVLTVMACTGADFAPFRPRTVGMYVQACKKFTDDEIKIEGSSIQYALESLRAKSLVWNSSRGVYAIEDSQHVIWIIEESLRVG